MQTHADLLGRPIVVAEEDEATVTGACALAALELGELTLDDLRARKTRVSACYQPVISADERASRRDRFTRAVALAREFQ
jgi:glycerol kinase